MEGDVDGSPAQLDTGSLGHGAADVDVSVSRNDERDAVAQSAKRLGECRDDFRQPAGMCVGVRLGRDHHDVQR